MTRPDLIRLTALALLREEAVARWIAHTERYEGRIPWLYLDILGLVTIGAGCLVDPVALALPLPLRRPDGGFATDEEIAAEWKALKARRDLAQLGAGAAGKIARLRLSDADLDALTWGRLNTTVAALVRRWPGLPSWPWQAQLAVCSWAWAVGTAAKGWPKFEAALHAQDWSTAAAECKIREEGNPGVAPRNVENRRLFLDAVGPAPVEPPVEDRPSSPPVVIVEDEAIPDTDPMTEAQRREVLRLTHLTYDRAARDAIADGYKHR